MDSCVCLKQLLDSNFNDMDLLFGYLAKYVYISVALAVHDMFIVCASFIQLKVIASLKQILSCVDGRED